MSESMYPKATRALAEKRSELAPETEAAFRAFGQAVFKDGQVRDLLGILVARVRSERPWPRPTEAS